MANLHKDAFFHRGLPVFLALSLIAAPFLSGCPANTPDSQATTIPVSTAPAAKDTATSTISLTKIPEQALVTPASSTNCFQAEDRLAETETANLKITIENFKWSYLEDKTKLSQYVSVLAKGYIDFTQTKNVTAKSLIEKTIWCRDTTSYINEVRKEKPAFELSWGNLGYSNYDTGKVFINLERLKNRYSDKDYSERSGIKIDKSNINQVGAFDTTSLLWHEWGHQDVVKNETGEYLNDVEKCYFDYQGGREPWKHYRGGGAYSQNTFGFEKTNEVFLNTFIIRALRENVGLNLPSSSGKYDLLGTDFFIPLTKKLNLSPEWLYQQYSNSRFEDIAKAIGEQFPQELYTAPYDTPFYRGKFLFVAIEEGDSQKIINTGVFQVFPEIYPPNKK